VAQANQFPKSNGFVKVEIAEPVTVVSAAGTGTCSCSCRLLLLPSSTSSRRRSFRLKPTPPNNAGAEGAVAAEAAKVSKKDSRWRTVVPEDTFYLPLRFPVRTPGSSWS
jgi:hypothetical protein